jgi:4-hydroxy-tetrahydrodipicolinate synthase
MVARLNEGKQAEAEALLNGLKPLFGIITVKTEEETPHGPVVCRARNPLAVKTLMAVLGMPVGPCRQPLGKMTRKGIQVVLEVGRTVWKNNPEILKPAGDFFDLDIEARLYDEALLADLIYGEY